MLRLNHAGRLTAGALLVVAPWWTACGPTEPPAEDGSINGPTPVGSGGQAPVGSGGQAPTGGAMSTGGIPAMGGETATGGAPSL